MWNTLHTAVVAALAFSSNVLAAVARPSSSVAPIPPTSFLQNSGLVINTAIDKISIEKIAKLDSDKGAEDAYSTKSSKSSEVGDNKSLPFLRGVNLGGWLVLEKWMNSDTFSGAFIDKKDQHDFDNTTGAYKALKKHWDTFFTESDIQEIAKTGINALRIPIGYWAYDNARTPYLKGADEYLEKAIGWARKADMKVWIDCHGSPGSQNGFDNSGESLGENDIKWQVGDNMARSIRVLKIMAKKYGSKKYSDVVVGLELVNEPISWGANKFSKTQSWAKDAFVAVKNASANPNLMIVMHDAFQQPKSWLDIPSQIKAETGVDAKNFVIDTHLYQVFDQSDKNLTQLEHIKKACSWSSTINPHGRAPTDRNFIKTYVGEWSAATDICINPDGTTTGGTTCSVSGCQCQTSNTWNKQMAEQIRRYIEAQLDTFEANSNGYFFWSAKGPGGWGFLNTIKNGAFPNPITSRKYPRQCPHPKY